MSDKASAPVDDLLDHSFKAGFPQIYLLGLALILAGPVGDWNRGFMIGFWSYFLEFMIISFGYLMLMTCLAEMTSIVAFASGAYGYVRCSVGPFYGFMIGICELLENSFVVITCNYAFAYGVTVTSGMSRNFEPLWMLLVYIGLFAVHSRGGWYFWTAMCIFAVLTVALVVIYCMTVMVSPEPGQANLIDESHEKFVDGGAGFMENLYRPMWLYIGAETLTIAGKNIANGPDVIPKTYMWVLLTIFALNVWVIFATAIDYEDGSWDDHVLEVLPLSFSFNRHLGMAYSAGASLVLAPNFAASLGFLYAAMHLTQAMSLSGLVSPFFQPTVSEAKVPMRALITNCVVQYAILVIGWAVSPAPPFFALCVIAACVVYVGVFAAYLTFHYKYASMERKFHNPFGVVGAWIGIAIFAVTFGVVAVVTIDSYVVYVFMGIMILSAIYYFTVVEARQFFSPEEQRRFMKAYILNANKKKKATTSMSLSRILERVGVSSASAHGTNKFNSKRSGSAQSAAASNSRHSEMVPVVASKKLNQVAAINDQPTPTSTAADTPKSPVRQSTRFAAGADSGDDYDEESPKLDAIQEAARASMDARDDVSQREVQAVWSGKVMDAASSQKFLKFITSGPPTSTRASLLAAGTASLKLGSRSSKTQDERAAGVSIAEDNVLEMLREEFPDQVVVMPVTHRASQKTPGV